MQQMRTGGYGTAKPDRDSASPSSRMLSLTDEELKSVPKEDGEICLSVYGTISGGEFKVSRVETESEEAE